MNDFPKNPSEQYHNKKNSNNYSRSPFPKTGHHTLQDIYELDSELIHLIVKRTRLLSKLPKTQSNQEKQIRIAWENMATKVSHDPRLIQQFFRLLQDVTIIPEIVEKTNAFSLAPSTAPVNVTLNIPSCYKTTQLYMALAAGAGLDGVVKTSMLNDPILECLKALNQAGASLRWEQPGTILCSNSEPFTKNSTMLIDKVIHIGNDQLSLYLLIFLNIIRPSRIKFIGKSALKFSDFSVLKSFLPSLGARLANVIHGQNGLPIRIEASAILPETIFIPHNLDKEAVLALFVATALCDKPTCIHLDEHPDKTIIAQTILPILHSFSSKTEVHTKNEKELQITIFPSKLVFPETQVSSVFTLATVTLLAIPAFIDGEVSLKKTTPQKIEDLNSAYPFLSSSGLTITETEDAITSKKTHTPSIIDFSNTPDSLFPIALTLALIPVFKNGGTIPLDMHQYHSKETVESYLLHLGFELGESGKLIPTHQKHQLPWSSPSIEWSLAYSLAAFLCPHLMLNNPGTIEALYPLFWRIYNNLPNPEKALQNLPNKIQPDEPELEPKPVQKIRRRIVTENTHTNTP